jgi:hypothetical protein
MPVQTRSQTKALKSQFSKNVTNPVLKLVPVTKPVVAPVVVPVVPVLKLVPVISDAPYIKPITKTKKPLATLVTEPELLALGLTSCSRDPTGKFRVVVKATDLEFIHVCEVTANYGREELHQKWAIAPQGYYWQHFSQKCYYSFDWYELRPIPVSV